ncbi:MAG TPA: COX15/CtaA family protein [Bacillota bacterium]|nr:COX15/CtaA family protein [Bacillota bacterium]
MGLLGLGGRLARFAWLVVAVLYVLVVVGGIVTASDSGLGCGLSWPSCASHLLPPGNLHGIVEWTHRMLAGVASVLVVALAALTWSRSRRLAAALVCTLALQVVLGGLVVLTNTPAALVAVHEGAALLLLDVALTVALRLSWPGVSRSGGGSAVLWFLAIWAGVTSIFGSYLAHLDTACAGLGGCLGTLAHAGGAFGAGLWHWVAALVLAGGVIAVLRQVPGMAAAVQRWVGWSLLALGVQVALGILLLATGLSPVMLALHEAVSMALGALLWGTASLAGIVGAAPLGAAPVTPPHSPGSGVPRETA